MSGAITVRPVTSWRDRRHFQRLPWMIYANDPNWVPPILAQERLLLGWGRHPFFDHAEMVTLLAERDGKVTGRLAVFVNDIHNVKYDEKRGFFGFFECVDDIAVARELFAAGHAWLRQRGMTAWRGPVNPSLNYTCGLLIDGFGSPPVFLMTYNRPYYAALIEACGFAKSQDMYAYEMDVALLAKLVDRYKPAVMSSLEGDDFVVRRFDRKRFAAEIRTFLEIYNRALDGTWGFTPLQQGEVTHIAKEMGQIIAPEFAAFAVVDLRERSELGPADPVAGAPAAGLGAAPVLRSRGDGDAACRTRWQGHRPPRGVRQRHPQRQVRREARVLRLFRMCRRPGGRAGTLRRRPRLAPATRDDRVAGAGQSFP